MARMRSTAERIERLLGTPVVSTTAVAGGDICVATRARLTDGRMVLVKTRNRPPAGFFETEARGLRWLGEPGVIPVAEVLAVDEECLILGWVDPGKPTPEAAASFGRDLAALHATPAPQLGGEREGFIGKLPMPNRTAPTWPEFFATRRILPYLKLAFDRGAVEDDDVVAVEGVVRRIVELTGPEPTPARLHGDLWSGNLVWTHDAVTLVDPAAHGGHPETDLGLLALFGAPHHARILSAYQEVRPLADGWEHRQSLHQLYPLLVHAAMFGGGYGRQAATAARRLV